MLCIVATMYTDLRNPTSSKVFFQYSSILQAISPLLLIYQRFVSSKVSAHTPTQKYLSLLFMFN